MADLAAKTVLKSAPRAGVGSYPIANGVVVYEGMLAQLEGGYLNHWDETGDFLGVVVGGDDRAKDGVLTGATSDSPPPEARVDESGMILMRLSIGGTPTQAKVGDPVYCATSNVSDLTLTPSGSQRAVGRLIRYRSATDVDVMLYTPAEMAGEYDIGSIGFISEAVNLGDFTDGGGTSGTYQMADSVPAGAIILGTKVTVEAGFAGDTTAVLTIGDGSDVDRYMTGTPSVFATAASGIQTGVPSGNKLITAANQPTLTVTSGSDFGSVSAGDLTVYVFFIRTA